VKDKFKNNKQNGTFIKANNDQLGENASEEYKSESYSNAGKDMNFNPTKKRTK